MTSTIDTSGIDTAKPIAGTPTTASVRTNFTQIKTALGQAKTDIEALQAVDTNLTNVYEPLITVLSVAKGGTAASTSAGARLALSAAKSGSNSDITSILGLTTALSISQGGTGKSTTADALFNLAAAPNLGGLHPTRYHGGHVIVPGSNGSVTLSANALYVVPFLVTERTVFARLGVKVNTGASGLARLGIYRWASGAPTSLVFDAGAVSITASGTYELTLSSSSTLDAGVYGLTMVCSSAPIVLGGGVQSIGTALIGTGTPGATDYLMKRDFSFSALPSSWGTPTYVAGTDTMPTIWMRL